ncbi:hypothetical protein RvY_08192 [Ramazzottius varieornatus]|uniref:Ig-like domain-containing protein n=1 Tax=Ramazzottius varieornatus TaxID=947166 RepID=A0A1D1V503_RAMVA|nr:hypothetical protein RvY_08192 [Ramazzottius varieornatus]
MYLFPALLILTFHPALSAEDEFVGTEESTVSGVTVHYVHAFLNNSVTLLCDGSDGTPTWTDPLGRQLPFFSNVSKNADLPKYYIEASGTLVVLDITRYNGGYYWCTRNGLPGNATIWHVMINSWFRYHLEIESVMYGWYAGLGTLILGITIGLMKLIVRICCPQCHARASAAARVQQMRLLIVALETYRHDQSTRLRENYTAQVEKLKENCAAQMEGLRDHYGTKINRFRNYRLPFGNTRDQYWQQVTKVRDYGSSQMERLQDNYAKNLGKLRTYSVAQLERFRQQYQLQHKHMAKILEAMNFTLDCRAGGAGEMTPSPSILLNMDLSLAQLRLEASDLHSGGNSSDSITCGGPQVSNCVVQMERTRGDVPVLDFNSDSMDFETSLENEPLRDGSSTEESLKRKLEEVVEDIVRSENGESEPEAESVV